MPEKEKATEKRVVVRVMYDKLDIDKLPQLVKELEAVADQYGEASTESTILGQRPAR